MRPSPNHKPSPALNADDALGDLVGTHAPGDGAANDDGDRAESTRREWEERERRFASELDADGTWYPSRCESVDLDDAHDARKVRRWKLGPDASPAIRQAVEIVERFHCEPRRLFANMLRGDEATRDAAHAKYNAIQSERANRPAVHLPRWIVCDDAASTVWKGMHRHAHLYGDDIERAPALEAKRMVSDGEALSNMVRAVRDSLVDDKLSIPIPDLVAKYEPAIARLEAEHASVGYEVGGSLVVGLTPEVAAVLVKLRADIDALKAMLPSGANVARADATATLDDLPVAPQSKRRGADRDVWADDGDALLVFLHVHGMSAPTLAELYMNAASDWMVAPLDVGTTTRRDLAKGIERRIARKLARLEKP